MPKDYSHITLLVDMDDTIENLLPAWAEWLNRKHGTSVKPDDITDWNVQKFFPSLTKDDVYAPLYEDEFWGTVQPKEDAVDSFEDMFIFIKHFRLHVPEDDIVIYTGYNEDEIVDKVKILSKFKNIIIKYGRFIPNDIPHLDEILGVNLASKNQYAKRIS